MESNEELLAQYLLNVSHELAIFLRGRVGASTEDVMSEITVLAFQNINKLCVRNYEEFTYWVFNVAQKKVKEWYRKNKAQAIPLETISTRDLVSVADRTDSPLSIYLLREEKERLITVLERLKKSDKLIYKEHYSENLTFQEISDRHNIPLSTVLSRHRRFLEKLRLLLDNQKNF